MIQFENFQEFIAMGGYAANVWSVYAMFAVFLTANLLLPLRKKKRLLNEIKRRQIVNQETGKQSGSDEPAMPSLEPLLDTGKAAGEST